MNILALETSTDCCSVALCTNDRIFEKQAFIPQKHEKVLLTWIEELFEQALLCRNEINAICYSCGPGGFTGIRIGAAIAQGLALARDLDILAIPSLQVIAQGFSREHEATKVIVIQDARIEQVYLGFYQIDAAGVMQPVVPDKICKLAEIDFDILNKDAVFVSNIVDLKGLNFNPCAKDVLFLGQYFLKNEVHTKALDALPIYLRTEGAWKKLS